MAVYRSDQAQLTFGFEPAPGGYAELASNATVITGGSPGAVNGVINNSPGGYPAGTTAITVTEAAGTWVKDIDIRIGPGVNGNGVTTGESEIRRVLHVESLVLYLDAPTSFAHPHQADVDKVSSATTVANDMYITSIPGVYDTVDVPDPDMTIEPRYFLGTKNKRNYAVALRGQQTYAGSVSGIVLLDGRPLRFPFGKVVTHTANSAAFSPATSLAADTAKGDIFVSVDASSTLSIAANELVVFGYVATAQSNSTMEVRKVVSGAVSSGTTATLQLDKPLQFAHSNDDVLRKMSANPTYTHHIYETVDLDTVSWHVHMKDSAESATNNFDRRYYGGLIGSASIAADEGGMVNMSWDGVNFQGMQHNQQIKTSATNFVPHFGLMATVDNDNVEFPTTQPYFFSQGSVTMFGQEIARIRSFSLSVSNGEEPRYYVNRRLGEKRGPSEIREGRREYSMTASLALPDSQGSTSTSTTLFKELLLEGGAGQAGFDVVVTFTRGTNDSITIHIPGNEDTSNDQITSAAGIGTSGANAGLWQSGAIIRTAPHSITGDNPVQVDADILFRNIKIEVNDSLYYYP